MSLLTICQHVARSIPVEVPTVIVGSANDTAKLLLACAQDEGEALSKTPNHSWTALVKEHTFSTVASTASYSLPSDFEALIDDTAWDRTNYWKMRGNLTPAEWQSFKSSVLGNTVTTYKRFRIKDNSGTVEFYIDPTPTAVESIVFEYISNGWCTDSGGTAQTEWAADDDLPVLDEYLFRLGMKWRMLKRLGMAYGEERDEYDRQVSIAKARDGGARAIRIDGPSPLQLIGSAHIPETGFGS